MSPTAKSEEALPKVAVTAKVVLVGLAERDVSATLGPTLSIWIVKGVGETSLLLPAASLTPPAGMETVIVPELWAAMVLATTIV